MQRNRHTYNVRGIAAHGNNRPVNRSEQLLHDDLNVPLGGALQNKKVHCNQHLAFRLCLFNLTVIHIQTNCFQADCKDSGVCFCWKHASNCVYVPLENTTGEFLWFHPLNFSELAIGCNLWDEEQSKQRRQNGGKSLQAQMGVDHMDEYFWINRIREGKKLNLVQNIVGQKKKKQWNRANIQPILLGPVAAVPNTLWTQEEEEEEEDRVSEASFFFKTQILHVAESIKEESEALPWVTSYRADQSLLWGLLVIFKVLAPSVERETLRAENAHVLV